MKPIYLLLILMTLIVSGCVSSASNSGTPSATEDPRLTPMKKFAADKLGIKQSDLVFVSMLEEEWPDACLGLPDKEEMCAMVVTPGYLVIFNSPQGRVEFHTNKDLSYFRMAPVGSLSTVLTWQRSGGIAGICENLEIKADNTFTLTECSGAALAQGKLSDADAADLLKYVQQFAVIDWFSKQQPGSADMFNDHFILYGQGQEKPSDSQLEQFNEWISALAGRLKEQGLQSQSGSSGIEGIVTIGPTCPGPVRIGDTECADKPYLASISILDSAGKPVTSVQTDKNGYYRIPLSAGKYTLVPESTSALPFADKQEVEVLPGTYISVDIHYDSGMR